jgi:hypothetical protein
MFTSLCPEKEQGSIKFSEPDLSSTNIVKDLKDVHKKVRYFPFPVNGDVKELMQCKKSGLDSLSKQSYDSNSP